MADCIAIHPEVLNRLGCTSKLFALFLIVLFHFRALVPIPALLLGPAVPFLRSRSGGRCYWHQQSLSWYSWQQLQHREAQDWGSESWPVPATPWITLDSDEFESSHGNLLARGVPNKTTYSYGYMTRLSSCLAECKTASHVSKCWENCISFPFNY